MSEHSLLSPSSSSRWIKCSGSVLLPQFDSSDHKAANEGTLAHKIAEYKLQSDEWYDYEKELDEIRHDKLYSPEMEADVDGYKIFIDAKPYTRRLFEEYIDLSFISPDFFGTADCILVDRESKTLEIIDFKYGRVRVSPEKNTQLMIYALGAAKLFRKELNGLDDFTVKLSIYQPRIFNIDTWEISWKKLCDWYSKILIPAVGKIAYEVLEENKGYWCQYCKSKIFCSAYNEDFVIREDTQLRALNNSDIEENYELIKETEKYLKELKKYMVSEIKNGKHFDNYKLVTGNKKKNWKDEIHLMQELKANGDIDKVTELVSPAEMEKRLGKEDMENYYNRFIETTYNEPLLVKRSDKRKELVFEN